ncbi:MAG: amino acid permease, partial [Mesorhizobium sp.]
IFAYVNAIFMGAGAKVWNPMALWAGLITAALILPVFCFRHYIQDGGKFPDHMLDDLGMKSTDLRAKKAGLLPYATLAAGLIVVLIADRIFVL